MAETTPPSASRLSLSRSSEQQSGCRRRIPHCPADPGAGSVRQPDSEGEQAMEYFSQFEDQQEISQEPIGLARNELAQAAETGRDVSALRARLTELDDGDHDELLKIYQDILALPAPRDWPHFEGSGLEDIQSELPPANPTDPISGEELADRVHGAWVGRIAGNLLGKPWEIGWDRHQIKTYLQEHDAYPLTDYAPIDDEANAAKLGFTLYGEGMSQGRVDGGVRDDDIDYTVLGLHLLRTYGHDYTSIDVAREWLYRFPVYQLYTAERAVYQNLIRKVALEQVAEFENPYREWIGALIRADIYGYRNPGNPRAAALLAYPDAALSHRANGIYGAMWAAALIAIGFINISPTQSIRDSLQHIPPTSRLAVEITTVLADFEAGLTWDTTMDKLDARWRDTSWVHVLPNAGALTDAILWGNGDYTATVALAIQSGLDTDSIAATAGSFAGARLGARALPTHLTSPLRDRYTSAVFGYDISPISTYATNTLRMIETAADNI